MRRRARAFTLIELLVVLVLLGILVGLAVLASGSSSSSRELRDEARRLAALIGVLSDEAVLDSREYGLLVSDAGYRVLRLDEATGRWDEPDRSRGRQLPEWMRLQLELDGTPLRLLDPARGESDRAGLSREDQEPQLLILSSGELSPFTLRLSERRADGNAWRLSSAGRRRPRAEPLESRR